MTFGTTLVAFMSATMFSANFMRREIMGNLISLVLPLETLIFYLFVVLRHAVLAPVSVLSRISDYSY